MKEPSRTLARFAPTVLAHAQDGDAVAADIVDGAVRRLAATVLAVADPAEPLSVVGGLTGYCLFTSKLTEALQDGGLQQVPPAGDALAGAAELAGRTDLLHERYAIRVRPELCADRGHPRALGGGAQS